MCNRNAPDHQQADSAVGHSLHRENPLHGETLFVIPTTDSDHITFHSSPRAAAAASVAVCLSWKTRSFSFIVHFNELLAASVGKEMLRSILRQPPMSEAPQKGVIVVTLMDVKCTSLWLSFAVL